MNFEYVLARLPTNDVQLTSDASSSYGMAGVILFEQADKDYIGVDGLCWQTSWEAWTRIMPTVELATGSVKINVAEYIAALITCETFADFCAGKITMLQLDNITAKTWLATARCPRAPYDRCGQGLHLYMIKRNMKIMATWIPSAENVLADILSRKRFAGRNKVHVVSGYRLQLVVPKYHNLLSFCKK